MRLIDADALKYKNLAEVNGILTYVLTAEEINNAPTVEPQKIVTIPHELIEKFALCVVDTVEKIDWDKAIEAYMKRPQGEWIFNTSFWSCSVCKESVKTIGYCGDKKFMNEFFRFCPNCGASMKPKTCTNCETFGQDCGDCEVGDDD